MKPRLSWGRWPGRSALCFRAATNIRCPQSPCNLSKHSSFTRAKQTSLPISQQIAKPGKNLMRTQRKTINVQIPNWGRRGVLEATEQERGSVLTEALSSQPVFPQLKKLVDKSEDQLWLLWPNLEGKWKGRSQKGQYSLTLLLPRRGRMGSSGFITSTSKEIKQEKISSLSTGLIGSYCWYLLTYFITISLMLKVLYGSFVLCVWKHYSLSTWCLGKHSRLTMISH